MTASPIRIFPVASRRDRDRFFLFPRTIYRGDPHWVEPLQFDVRRRLDPKINPFFEHAEAQLFIAERNGETVGRIAAIVDSRHNETHKDAVGFFGWFESIDDQEVASALIEAAAVWNRKKDRNVLRGPVQSSLNEECGLLIDGYDLDPVLMMPYNPPYFERLLEGCGFRKAMDLYSFKIIVKEFGADRMERIVKKVMERERLVIRNFDVKNFASEIEKLKVIYNDAWVENWGFVTMTDQELEHMAKDLKPILEPRWASFVEVDGKAVGFSLVLPNIYEIVKTMKGKLFPFGFLKLLLGVKKTQSGRLLAMGVHRDYHLRGLDAVLYFDSFKNATLLQKVWADIGWVLETNRVMINTIEKLGGKRYKTHRLYDRPIA